MLHSDEGDVGGLWGYLKNETGALWNIKLIIKEPLINVAQLKIKISDYHFDNIWIVTFALRCIIFAHLILFAFIKE